MNLAISAILIIGCAQPSKTTTPQPSLKPSIESSEIVVKTKHGNISLEQIAEIQPGLGTVMMEYSIRFYRMYVAAEEGKLGSCEISIEGRKRGTRSWRDNKT